MYFVHYSSEIVHNNYFNTQRDSIIKIYKIRLTFFSSHRKINTLITCIYEYTLISQKYCLHLNNSTLFLRFCSKKFLIHFYFTNPLQKIRNLKPKEEN